MGAELTAAKKNESAGTSEEKKTALNASDNPHKLVAFSGLRKVSGLDVTDGSSVAVPKKSSADSKSSPTDNAEELSKKANNSSVEKKSESSAAKKPESSSGHPSEPEPDKKEKPAKSSNEIKEIQPSDSSSGSSSDGKVNTEDEDGAAGVRCVGDLVKIGDVLDGRYELDEIVGRGGCGVVFRATDLNLQRDVAVKVLSMEGVNQPETLERFEREGQILRRLHAPNTVFFYDSGQTPHHLPYIVMEFVTGCQLKDRIQNKGRISPDDTVAILTQVMQALSEAHEYGFVHRDLKPGNIMLCERLGFPKDFVKVLDFGIAKIASDDETGESDIAGTPKYMSPEQFKNETLTPAADLYSTGCIAYEMLTGIAPFEGDTLHIMVAKQLFMIPKSLGPEFDIYPNLEATIFKLLEKKPEDRFACAQEVIEALEHWQEPELIPMLAGARTHGDDDSANSFLSDDSSDSQEHIPVAYAAALNNMSLRGIYAMPQEEPAESPLDIAVAEHAEMLKSQYAMKCKEEDRKAFRLYAIWGAAALAVCAFVVILLVFVIGPLVEADSQNNDSAESIDLPVEEAHVVSIKQQLFIIDALADQTTRASVVSLALGIQTPEILARLYEDDEMFDENEELEKDDSSKPPKKNKNRRSSNNKVIKDNKDNIDTYEIFNFIVKYKPKNARVSFVNAVGQCHDGTCSVRTISDKQPTRVVVAAPGFAPKSMILKQKVSTVRVELTKTAGK